MPRPAARTTAFLGWIDSTSTFVEEFLPTNVSRFASGPHPGRARSGLAPPLPIEPRNDLGAQLTVFTRNSSPENARQSCPNGGILKPTGAKGVFVAGLKGAIGMTWINRTLPIVLALSLVGVAFAKDEKDTATKKAPKNPKQDVEAIGERQIAKGPNFYSIQKEIALGKRMAQDVERHSKIVDDPVIAEYVNRIGQNLVRNSDAKVPFTIKLIDSADVNAFALPGGFFFVNSGLMLRAESESELAGVMAHEIAHVAARHGTRQATKGQLISIATIPLMFIGGWTGYGIYQASSFLIPMTFLRFSRGMESEADFLGVQYLYKSGYDPTSFIDFFEKMLADEKRKPGTISKFFRSHPPHGSRIRKVQKTIDELLPNRAEYVVTTSEFLEVKQRLEQLVLRRKSTTDDPNKPRLRRTSAGGTIPTDDIDVESTEEEEDERPTLKRR